MKKLTLSIIAFLLATNMFAQEITAPAPEYYKHEVSITYGAFSMPWIMQMIHPVVLGSLNLD
ncbi:MAG: hypothetical protein LBV46_03460, partial [Bacteroidales bacterium]|nr:hypothetical protein [Bacteroidales bacterium]